MTNAEGLASPEFDEQELTEVFDKFVEIANAHNGTYESVIDLTRTVEVTFVPAGYLGMDSEELEDHPHNLIDMVYVYIHDHREPNITITQTFGVVAHSNLHPEMVEKDLELNEPTVEKFYRGVVFGGMLGHTALAELNDSDELPEHLRPKKGASADDIASNDPETCLFFPIDTEFDMTSIVINPGFLRKFDAPDEVLATAERIVELATERAHKFNQQDFHLIKDCLNQISA